MQQAYGDWVGSQVNVAALGSLNHFKHLQENERHEEAISETPKSQGS